MTHSKLNGVFLDRDSLGQDLDLSPLLELELDIEWQLYSTTQPHQVLARCEKADVIITNKVVIDGNLIRQLPNLKLICVAATGTNNVDLETASDFGVEVKNITDYAGTSVAQLVFSLILELANNTQHYRSAVQQGKWSQSPFFCLLDFPIIELAGKTISLIGYGSLAKSVEKIAEAFEMNVLVAERKGATLIRPNRVAFEYALEHADVLSIHSPLNDQTLNLIAEPELKLMKSTSFLINTARGGIVNESALLSALENNQIAGAASDVLTQEPPHEDHSMLRQQPENLLITPHIAWASLEARQRLLSKLVTNIKTSFQSCQ